MPKTVRKSNSRRSSENNVLNYSSDFDQNTRRDSKWWRDLSDKSIRRTIDVRNRGNNESGILSDGSISLKKWNCQWYQNLTQEESLFLQSTGVKRAEANNSNIEEVEKSANESQNDNENVVRKTLFTERHLSSGNHRFSRAFQLEPEQTKQTQVQQDELEISDNSKTNNKEINNEDKLPHTDYLFKKKKRKTVQLFSQKPHSHRFSAAFHKQEEEKIENDQQNESKLESQSGNEGNEQDSEIVVPSTQENFKSQNTFVEENIEVNATLVTSQTNSEITNYNSKKRIFSFAKSETPSNLIEQPLRTEKLVESNKPGDSDTDDSDLNQNERVRINLFPKKQPARSKFSEAFSKTKPIGLELESIDETNEDIAPNQREDASKSEERQFKFPRKSQQNDSEQMDTSENIQTKQDLFRAKVNKSRTFSDAFAESKNLEISVEEILPNVQINGNTNNSTTAAMKSLSQSKKNESRQLELSENVQIKENIFKNIVKEGNDFSNVFTSTKNVDEILNNEEENMPVEISRITRISTRNSENNAANQMEISESIQTKKLFAKDNKRETRKFSEAFISSKVTENEANHEICNTVPDTEDIERESTRINSRFSREKSKLCTIPVQNEMNETATNNQNELHRNAQQQSKNKKRSLSGRSSDEEGSSKDHNIKKISESNEILKKRKEMLSKAMKNFNPGTSRSIQKQIPSTKITDFFSKLNMNALPKITLGKVTKSKPTAKPVHEMFLVNGKKYRPKKLFNGPRWCNKRFYNFLQEKMQNKHGERTILESENLMKFIVNYVKIITKSKKYCPIEISHLKKELARNNIIVTTFDFYRFIEHYLPSEFRGRVIPCTRAHHAEPPIPYNGAELFTPIQF